MSFGERMSEARKEKRPHPKGFGRVDECVSFVYNYVFIKKDAAIKLRRIYLFAALLTEPPKSPLKHWWERFKHDK